MMEMMMKAPGQDTIISAHQMTILELYFKGVAKENPKDRATELALQVWTEVKSNKKRPASTTEGATSSTTTSTPKSTTKSPAERKERKAVDDDKRCEGLTKTGEQCGAAKKTDEKYCQGHLTQQDAEKRKSAEKTTTPDKKKARTASLPKKQNKSAAKKKADFIDEEEDDEEEEDEDDDKKGSGEDSE